jgi:hypothetical protein
LLGAQRAIRFQILELAPGVLKLRVGLAEAIAKRFQAGEVIEHVELVPRLEQVLVIVLPVDIDQVLGDVAEHGDRDRVSVEADAGATRCVEPPRQQDLATVRIGVRVGVGDGGDPLQDAGLAHLKDTADATFIRAGAKHLGGTAQAQQDFQGADDQRLSRPGGAGEAVECRMQLDASVRYHGQVGDVQFPQHPDHP